MTNPTPARIRSAVSEFLDDPESQIQLLDRQRVELVARGLTPVQAGLVARARWRGTWLDPAHRASLHALWERGLCSATGQLLQAGQLLADRLTN